MSSFQRLINAINSSDEFSTKASLQVLDNSNALSASASPTPQSASTSSVVAQQVTTRGINDTIGTATNLGTISGTRQIRDAVNSTTDRDDFYRIQIGQTSNFTATISGLSSDADLRLIRDSNNNGQIDSADVIAGSFRGGTNTDTVNLPGLVSGIYFVQVNKFGSGSTNYNLTLNATAGLGRETEPTTDLGNIAASRFFTGSVNSSNDVEDIYRFRVQANSSFAATLGGLSSDADLRLIRDANNNGRFDAGETIVASSTNGGTRGDSIFLDRLDAGNYLVRVNKFGSGNTNYNVFVGATPLA